MLKMRFLATNTQHPALPGGWRYWMHKRWMIAHEIVGAETTVHRIVDATRDLPRIF